MEYDVIVIGSGAGGYYSAISCSESGLKTALIERKELGGTAFRWGSLAVKRILDGFRRADESLLKEAEVEPKEYYRRRYNKEIEEMSRIESWMEKRLEEKGVDIIFGEGKIIGDRERGVGVRVGERVIDGENLILATGTQGSTLWSGERIITHKELLAMEDLPERICIVGGNVEGIELANITSYMEIETVVVEMEDSVLKGTEEELVLPVVDNLRSRGVEFLLNTKVEKCEDLGDRVRVSMENREEMEFPLLVVTGVRRPNLPEGAGIEVRDGYIAVDGDYRTSHERIYAVGDINGIMGMANAARYQGEQMGDVLTGSRGRAYPKSLSRAIYTIPEIACTGFQGEYSGTGYFADTFRGFSKGVTRGAGGFVRVHSDMDGRITGISMWGDDVSEYLGAMGNFVDRGMKLEEAREIMMAHPTMMEAFHDAVVDVIKSITDR